MERTTIMLSAELKEKAATRAQKMKISLGQLIRQSLERFITEEDPKHREDPFFTDPEIFNGDAEEDLALHHDKYLYGEENDDIH